jgi:hypothetical protein
MTKYGITHKKMNDQGTHIDEVEVREIKGKKVGFQATIWSRAEVVSALKEDNPIITILRKDVPKWVKGEDVRVVKVNGAEYLRTDQNLEAADHLGNLPDFGGGLG